MLTPDTEYPARFMNKKISDSGNFVRQFYFGRGNSWAITDKKEKTKTKAKFIALKSKNEWTMEI
jgi:hypothetical protein